MLENVTMVLHRPSSAENIGSVARAMKNFGLSRLRIVAPPSWQGVPRGGGPGTAREHVLARAEKTARHASDLLGKALIYRDLGSALQDMVWSFGTTSRSPRAGGEMRAPRQMAKELIGRSAKGPVAVVFGEERRGLSDRELDLCQAFCTIPTTAAYDSMNLAAAVAVLSYEIALAHADGETRPLSAAPTASSVASPARHQTLEAFWDRLAEVLAKVGYLNPQNPSLILAEWRQLLARAEPSQREVELLVAAIRSIDRRLS